MQTIVNLGTGGADLNGQNGSTTSADSNDALFLDWPGDNGGNYVYLPGVSGNYLSVPDEAALDITGDIDIRVQVALDDWTPGSDYCLVGKYSAGGDNRSYRIDVRPSGFVRLYWSTDGTAAGLTNRESTVPTGLSDGSVKWVRATLDVTNGTGGHDVKFWLSDDGVTWSQLGGTVTTAGTTSIFAGARGVGVGATSDLGANEIAGRVYRAQILDGIDGTLVLDVDCSQISSGADTSFTALTGQTVTINRGTAGRKSVAVMSPVWLFGTDDKFVVAHNALLDVGESDDLTVVAVVRQWNTPASYRDVWNKGTTSPRIWLENFSTNLTYSFYVNDGVSGNLGENTGSYTNGALSVIGGRIDRSAGVAGVSQAFINGSFSSGDSLSGVGSFANTQDMLVGFDTSGIDVEILAFAIFRRALSATEIAALTTYYQNKVA